MVKNISSGVMWQGSAPGNLVGVGDMLYFSATDRSTGRELWRSDGTEAGTVLVKDLNPGSGSGSPDYLTLVNGTLFFSASDGYPRQ